MGLGASNLMGQCYPDRHSSRYFDAWRSCTPSMSPNPARGVSHWIQYELDMTMEIGQFHFWNINDPDQNKSGVQDYIIDYSIDGLDGTEFGQFALSVGTGSTFYEGEAGPDMGDIAARFILITALTNFDGSNPCIGFAEIRVFTSELTVPLELLKFDLQCKGENTLVKWSVTNSLNQESMILERSQDAKLWSEIHNELPAGLQQYETYQFEYLDASAPIGTNYYRLKLLDYDGSFEYSHIIESNCKQAKIKMDVYPIPTANFITIDFYTESEEDMEYEVSDIMGKVFMKGKQTVLTGGTKFELNLKGLPVGTFMVTLSQDGISVRKKIIKIKD